MKMKLKLKRALPKLPSDILKAALGELAVIESQPEKFDVNMWQWARGTYNGKCEVCLAGSLMISGRRLGPLKSIIPSDFSDSVGRKLDCINRLRVGNVEDALSSLDIKRPARLMSWFDVTPYHISPKKWRRKLNFIVRKLKQFNL